MSARTVVQDTYRHIPRYYVQYLDILGTLWGVRAPAQVTCRWTYKLRYLDITGTEPEAPQSEETVRGARGGQGSTPVYVMYNVSVYPCLRYV
jgi:hypothetical protein